MTRLQLEFSHRLDTVAHRLADEFAGRLGTNDALFARAHVIVPNPNIRLFLEQEISRRLGVVPNLEFHRLRHFLGERLPDTGEWSDVEILGLKHLHHILVDLLSDSTRNWKENCPEVSAYLGEEPQSEDERLTREYKVFQLADKLATLFAEYSFSRSTPVDDSSLDYTPFLDRWQSGDGGDTDDPLEQWQRVIWSEIFDDDGVLDAIREETGTRYMMLADALDDVTADELTELPTRIHVVGFAFMARVFVESLALLSQAAEVEIHALTPSSDWARGELPEELTTDDHHLLLRQWGRAGADHTALWSVKSDVSPTDTDDIPDGETLLAKLQRTIVFSDEESPEVEQDDESIEFFESPSTRREVEAVANKIWHLLDEDEDLKPDDVGVLIAGSDQHAYQAQIESIFDRFQQLPTTMVDLPAASRSRMLEAVELLLELPFGDFRRRELLRLLAHPNLRGRSGDVDPERWKRWCVELNIFHGADRRDHEETYLGEPTDLPGRSDYEWDLYNWDQGMRRLALGTFLSSDRDAGEGLFSVDGRDYYPLEVGTGLTQMASKLSVLVDSLVADARWLVEPSADPPVERPLNWAAIVEEMLETYLVPRRDGDDAFELEACRRIVRNIAGQCPVDGEISYRLFYQFVADELDELQKTPGNRLTGGVVVAPLLSMRAIPFDHVFVLGLGEAQFPNPEKKDALDLRMRDEEYPRVGDLPPADRDRYVFLETLLSANRSVTMSWVALDGATGEHEEPSSVVSELRWALERDFDVRTESRRELTRRHPLRRYDYRYFAQLAEQFGYADQTNPPETIDGEEVDLRRVRSNLDPTARHEAVIRMMRDELTKSDAGHNRRMPPLDDVRRQLRTDAPEVWEKLRQRLELPALPDQERQRIEVREQDEPLEPRRIELRLSQLRQFLESPLQGAAKVQLGLRDDEDDPFLEDWESIETGNISKAVHLRNIFEKVAYKGKYDRDFAALYEETLLPSAPLRGELPCGDFLLRDKDEHVDILETWTENLDGFDIKTRLRRSGVGRDAPEYEETAPPLRFEFTPEEIGSITRPVIVELTGRTSLRSPEGRHHVVLVPSSTKNTPKRRCYFLRGFLSIALSVAGELQPADSPAEVIVNGHYRKTHSGFRWDICPWSEHISGTPHGYLRQLIQDLLFSDEFFLFPYDFVDEIKKSTSIDNDTLDGVDRKELRDRVNGYLQNNFTSFRYEHGPVDNYEQFAEPPEDLDVRSLLRTRFPFFFPSPE